MNSEQLLDAIRNLSLKQCVEVRDALAETLKLEAVAVFELPRDERNSLVLVDPDPSAYSVRLDAIGANKIQVISTIRQALGLALGQAKSLVESAPALVLENVSKEDALALKAKLDAAGAIVSVL